MGVKIFLHLLVPECQAEKQFDRIIVKHAAMLFRLRLESETGESDREKNDHIIELKMIS